jgi:hypothetical protein
MFTSGMKESNQTTIEIKDWSHNSYSILMEYIYTGSISNFNPTVALELLGKINDLK